MSNNLKIFPSRIFLFLLLAAYTLAFVVTFIIPVFLPVKMGMVLLLTAAFVYYLRNDALLLLPTSPVSLRVEAGKATLLTRGGNEIDGEVARESLVTPMLTILNFSRQAGGKVRSVVIFPDSMDKEDFRQLRVLLKWGR